MALHDEIGSGWRRSLLLPAWLRTGEGSQVRSGLCGHHDGWQCGGLGPAGHLDAIFGQIYMIYIYTHPIFILDGALEQ